MKRLELLLFLTRLANGSKLAKLPVVVLALDAGFGLMSDSKGSKVDALVIFCVVTDSLVPIEPNKSSKVVWGPDVLLPMLLAFDG